MQIEVVCVEDDVTFHVKLDSCELELPRVSVDTSCLKSVVESLRLEDDVDLLRETYDDVFDKVLRGCRCKRTVYAVLGVYYIAMKKHMSANLCRWKSNRLDGSKASAKSAQKPRILYGKEHKTVDFLMELLDGLHENYPVSTFIVGCQRINILLLTLHAFRTKRMMSRREEIVRNSLFLL